MAQKAWMRFTGADKTIVGEIQVPKTPPAWFVGALATMNSGARREISMDDLTPRQWVDELCSQNRPIPLHRPLLTKLVDEDFYITQTELEAAAVKDERGEVVELDASKIKLVFMTSDLARAEASGKDLTKDYGPLVQVPDPKLIGRKPQKRLVHLPLLNPEDEVERTFAIFPSAFMVFVELEHGATLDRVAEGIYGAVGSQKVQLLSPAGA